MEEAKGDIEFSPVLIMEYIKQTTVGRYLASDSQDIEVKFKMPKCYYDEIMNYPLKPQFIKLDIQYNEENEILCIRASQDVINRYREQKSMIEIASLYEEHYAQRYKKYIEAIK